MNQHFIKFGIFYCLLLIGSFTSFAQIDTNTKGVKITLEIPPEIEVEKHDFNDPRATKEVDDSEKEELLKQRIRKVKELDIHLEVSKNKLDEANKKIEK